MKKSLFTILASLFAILTYAQLGVGTTTPNSTLDVRGSVATNYRSFTANTTAAVTDNLLVFTGTSAATVTLPTAIGCDGRSYMIKNASTTGPTPVLTIATASSQTIDGAGSWTLTSANETITLVSNGANWQVSAQSLPGGSGVNWTQNGNSVASLKSIGTINNFSLPFITNNTEKMRLSNTGSLGIGASTFNGTYPEKLLVDAGTTTSVNAIVGKGSIDSYLQLNIQNNSAGTNASSDVVATANNGSETTNYVDMGINGGSNTSGVMGAANDAYLYNIGQNMLVGTGSASKSLVFMTGGTTQSTNERMRIDGNGNVGIGNTNPLYKLQVTAASNPLYLGGVQTGAGTDSVVTINNGVIRKISAAAAAANAWSLTGNAATTPGTNFIGTTDAQALVIKENNTQVGKFDANSIAFGNAATINNSTNSYAIGSNATVGFNKSHAYAFGSAAAVSADSSFAIGIASAVNGNSSVAIGNGAAANNTNSVALGKSAFTAYTITDAVAIGTNATANNSNSIAIGSNSNSSNKTTTNAASAIAIGNNAISNSTNAIVIGTGATTGYNLTNPVAIGVSSSVGGHNGIALGNGSSTGFNVNATAIGAGAAVTGTANNSTALGYNAAATLPNEIILGDRSNNALSVGIGTESFSGTNREKLLVDAGTTTSVNAIVGKGSIDSYLQLNIQNNSAGTSASSDVVATANNGSETSNYIDMGINGGNYSGGVMGGANDGYLYTMGNNFLLGTANAAKSLVFMTGGTSQATNERMRIDGSGNVGIGITNPAYKLQVNATSNPLYLGGVQSGAGTDSVLTIANGVVKKLHPTALPGSNYGWGITGNTGINTATNFLGTTDDKQMILKSNGQSYLEFGRRQTLGLTQAFADYDDNDEKVTYVRSALQFDAPNASFYKPKMFTDANGNFRVKGSSAGTDFFEFGSTGASNNGGFEFIIGDDGDEPILFKSYHHINGMSEIMRLQSGRMAVGSNAFNVTNPEKLLIDAGVTTSYNLMTGKGSIDNYLQINVQNRSTGNSASSDLVATADNGTETNNYIDMGVNSSGYNNTAVPVLNGINNTYLYGAGNDLTIGNLGNNKPIIFFTTPNATQANAAERMRIDGTGNVGIGTTAATSTLQVNGSQALSITTKTATYTATASDYTIICNNSGAISINLPAAAGCSGRVYVIKKISAAFNNVTIDGNGSETIDGATTKVLTMPYESAMIQSNGTSWFILN